jgi:hypothetical protein
MLAKVRKGQKQDKQAIRVYLELYLEALRTEGGAIQAPSAGTDA